MQRKAILFAAVFAVILALNTVSALYVCDDSQTILKLGAVENSHVELYTSSMYPLKLCYSDVYGINYTLSNPHLCNGTNTVAKLAQTTNSHIESPNGTNFVNNVCYGDLSCSLRTVSCLVNENLVLTLAQQTNSHVSFNDTLPLKLCCSSAFALSNTNTTTSTNSSFGSVLGFSVISPINGSTYNDFVPINIATGTATSTNFSIDSGTVSNYISSTSISLPAGNHILVVQASNGSAFIQITIFFSIVDTSGSSSGSSSSGSSSGGRVGTSTVSQSGNEKEISGGDEPLFLEPSKSKKTFASLTLIQLLGTLIFLLIILVLLFMLFIHKKRKNRSN